MPEVCRLAKGSIKVCIYTNEHGEPHIHVEYDSVWVKVAIGDGRIIAGNLPKRQRRLVRKWLGTGARMPWKLGAGRNEANRSVKSPRNVLVPLFVIKGRPGDPSRTRSMHCDDAFSR